MLPAYRWVGLWVEVGLCYAGLDVSLLAPGSSAIQMCCGSAPRLGMPTGTLNQPPNPSSPACPVIAVQPGGQRDAGGQWCSSCCSWGQCRCVHALGVKASHYQHHLGCWVMWLVSCAQIRAFVGYTWRCAHLTSLPLTHTTCRGRRGQRVGRRPARSPRAAAAAGQPGAADTQPGAPAVRL